MLKPDRFSCSQKSGLSRTHLYGYKQSEELTFSSWSLLSSLKPASKMPSAIPNTFGILLNRSSIFFWNMSPAGAVLNGYLMYLYLLNGPKNMIKSYDFSSILRL